METRYPICIYHSPGELGCLMTRGSWVWWRRAVAYLGKMTASVLGKRRAWDCVSDVSGDDELLLFSYKGQTLARV